MSRDMSTVDAAFGFQPWGNVISANIYAIVTANAVALGPGMLMEAVGTAIATKKFGVLQAAISEEAGAVGSIIGAVLAVFDHNMVPVKYLAATTAGDSTVAGYALIADSPYQKYVAQEDGDTSSIVLNDIGLNANAIGTTVNTSTGISLMEIDSNTVNTTNTLAVKILGVHPDDTVDATADSGRYSRFIVMINSAHVATNVAGV